MTTISKAGRIGLVLLSVLLCWMTFLPMGFWWLAPIAWTPFLLAVNRGSFGSGVRLGLLFGVGLFAAVLTWLWNIFGAASIALWVMLALFSGVFGGIYAMLSSRYPDKWWLPVLAACLWTGIEWYRSEAFVLSFSWATPGMGIGPTCLSSWLGVNGMSWLIILGGALLVSSRGRFRLAGGCVSVLALGLGFAFHFSKPSDPENPLTVRLVQHEDGIMGDFIEHSADASADLIIWPEYALPFGMNDDSEGVKRIQDEVIKGSGKIVVLGTKTDVIGGYYNTAMTLDANSVLGRFFKNHTVHLFSDGIAGEEALPVETPFGKLGTPICFDCDHEDVVRKMAATGALAFAVPSMDPEPWGSRQHNLHAELFQHRAAENGRWMAVASSSGMTQIIDDRGRRVGSIPLMDPGVLDGVIGRRDDKTVYTRVGWLFGPACGLGAFVWIVGIIYVRLSRVE